MDTKQVIVIRKDLKMRKGKMIAQGAHASLKVIFDMMGCVDSDFYELTLLKKPAVKLWLEGQFKKICLYVNSEEELINIYNQAKDAGIICALIEDNGLTEFNGVKTKTCIAIGPDYSENIDKITKDLPLL